MIKNIVFDVGKVLVQYDPDAYMKRLGFSEQTKEKLKFLEDVDGAIFSFEYQCIKPEKEIYDTLCEVYSLEPQQSVFLDDRLDNIEQATKMGFYGIQFQDYEKDSRKLEQLLAKENRE